MYIYKIYKPIIYYYVYILIKRFFFLPPFIRLEKRMCSALLVLYTNNHNTVVHNII